MAQAGVDITSPANARVKQLVALRHRRARDRAGVTLVEGYEELGLALSAGARPLTLYVCPDLAGGDAQPMIDRVAGLGAEVVRVSRAVFGKIAYRESPDGWLAVLPQVPAGLSLLDLGPRPLVLVCEGVEKPGNLGAILRTADAAGVAAVVAADPGTDWGNPNVVRASKGTVFSVPVASAPSAEVLAWIAGWGGRAERGGGRSRAVIEPGGRHPRRRHAADRRRPVRPDGDRGRLGGPWAARGLAGPRRRAGAHPHVRPRGLPERRDLRRHSPL